jgi:hypothetical protein
MSDQDQERFRGRPDVEAHRTKVSESEEPKDEIDRARENDEGDEVEAHRASHKRADA